MRKRFHFQKVSTEEIALRVVVALQHLEAQLNPRYRVVRVALAKRYPGDLKHLEHCVVIWRPWSALIQINLTSGELTVHLAVRSVGRVAQFPYQNVLDVELVRVDQSVNGHDGAVVVGHFGHSIVLLEIPKDRVFYRSESRSKNTKSQMQSLAHALPAKPGLVKECRTMSSSKVSCLMRKKQLTGLEMNFLAF